MKRISLLLFGCVCTVVFIAGCGSNESTPISKSTGDEVEVVATIGEWTFTAPELQEIVDQLPEHQRIEYDTPGGRVELTDKMIEQELWFQEGLRNGIDQDPEVLAEIERIRRDLIITKFYNDHIEPLAYPDEEEVYDYYQSNPSLYTIKEIRRAQHIFSKSNPDRLAQFKVQILAGEPMTTLAHKFSEDYLTRDDGGDLGFFNRGGYIRGAGHSVELNEACFMLDVGVVSDPVQWERGWSIIRVNEIRLEKLRPFEEVREQILSEFVKRSIDVKQAQAFRALKQDYEVRNHLEEELALTTRTPEELWNLAQTSADAYHRIRNYQEIVDRYPEHEYAPQALFMVGFVSLEELKNQPDADRAFTRVLADYPDSEVVSMARYMLANIDKPPPEFDDLDDLGDKISNESD